MTSDLALKTIPRLRWKVDGQDQSILAVPAPRNGRFRGDFLFFQGEGLLGVAISRRPTMAKFRGAVRSYERMVGDAVAGRRYGDLEGNLIFRYPEGSIPQHFFKARVEVTPERRAHLQRLRERMTQKCPSAE